VFSLAAFLVTKHVGVDCLERIYLLIDMKFWSSDFVCWWMSLTFSSKNEISKRQCWFWRRNWNIEAHGLEIVSVKERFQTPVQCTQNFKTLIPQIVILP